MAAKNQPVKQTTTTETEISHDLELLSAVTHDLKAPLGAVRGFIELMEHAGPFNAEQKRLSDRAFGALEHMQDLINSVMDLARLENGSPLNATSTDIVDLLHQCIDIVQPDADKKHLEVHIDAPDTLMVTCDPHLMRRVLVNLLSNAVKYNHDGGHVFARILSQGNIVRVDVEDTGEGIPEDEQERVFDRFYRSRRVEKRRISGSGLGLAIVKMIIQLHRGHIWLASVPGEGSTFSFSLPAHPAPAVGSSSGWTQRSEQPDDQAARENSDAVDDNTQEGFSPAEREPHADQE